VGVLLGWSVLNWLMTSCLENQLFDALKIKKNYANFKLFVLVF